LARNHHYVAHRQTVKRQLQDDGVEHEEGELFDLGMREASPVSPATFYGNDRQAAKEARAGVGRGRRAQVAYVNPG
jgi:hypothetical protein